MLTRGFVAALVILSAVFLLRAQFEISRESSSMVGVARLMNELQPNTRPEHDGHCEDLRKMRSRLVSEGHNSAVMLVATNWLRREVNDGCVKRSDAAIVADDYKSEFLERNKAEQENAWASRAIMRMGNKGKDLEGLDRREKALVARVFRSMESD